jgi:hypothetical protein
MTTRTRPNGRKAARRAQRPRLESLEDRTVLSVTFGVFNDGIWAFNTAPNTGWRHISNAIPNAMDEGASGTLFESQPGGTFRYDYFANNGQGKWTQLTVNKASALNAAHDNTFFGSYASGTWEFDNSGWHLLTSNVATKLAAVSDNHVYGSYGGNVAGTWYFNGAWHLIAPAVPNAMDASPGGALFASYAIGT